MVALVYYDGHVVHGYLSGVSVYLSGVSGQAASAMVLADNGRSLSHNNGMETSQIVAKNQGNEARP